MRSMRQAVFAAALLGATLVGGVPALGAELTVAFHEGIEANRNFEIDGMEDRQWARAMGPEMAAYMQVVHIPIGWTDLEVEKRSPLALSQHNEAGVAVYATALETVEPAVQSDFDLGSRVVSGLQAVAEGERDFVGRYERTWQLWEVLADARGADTLSIAYAAVQTLQHVGVPAKLGLYPVGERMAFGVLIDTAVPASAEDGLVVDTGGKPALFAVDRRALPEGPIDADAITAWSWAEITAIDWDPELAPEPGQRSRRGRGGGGEAPPSEPGEQPERDEPDICAQAEALGLECRSTRGDEKLMIAGSVGLLVLLALWGVYAWRRRRERLQRVAAAKAAKKETEF